MSHVGGCALGDDGLFCARSDCVGRLRSWGEHIILDHTNDLLGEFASRLRDGAYDREEAEWVFLLVYSGS